MEHSNMDNVTQIHYIWPTLIYSFNSNSNILQEHEKMIADIKDDVNGKKRQSPYGPRYQAGFEKFGLNQGRDDLHNLPSFKKFSIFIEQLSTEILIEEGFKNQTIQITNMWANQQNDGSVHPPHSHANSVLSGVYYIKATNESSKIHFFDPRAQAKVLKPRRDTFTSDNSNVYGIPSVTGTGAIFPSWLMHWAPPNTGERISISWNILVRGDYGEPGTFQNANI